MKKAVVLAIPLSLCALAALLTLASSCTQIETGEVGIMKRFGEVHKESLPPGLHFYNPFTSKVVDFEVREQKVTGETNCFTKDTQNAKITFAITYSSDAAKAVEIYSTLGSNWQDKLITPIVLGHLKDVTGQYIADELIAKREAVKNTVLENLRSKLSPRGVSVTNVEFTNIDFDDAYEKAVEAKVVALQKAAEAKNKTVEVEEQARQRVIAAEAEAKAIRIQSEALAQNKSLVEFEAVKKWDGKLPEYIAGDAIPFIGIGSAKKE